jgi:hypothetical protein
VSCAMAEVTNIEVSLSNGLSACQNAAVDRI